MSLSESVVQPSALAATGWSIAGRLTLWYAASAFMLVAVSTGVLYGVLVSNVDRQDDQLLVDTVQIVRGLIWERPDDTDALHQEVEWEGTARRYAQLYVRILDEEGRVVVETPGTSVILTGHQLETVRVDEEPGPGVDVTSAAGTPYRMLAARAREGPDGRRERIIQAVLDRTAEQALLATYRTRLWGVLALALLTATAVGYLIARRGMRPVEVIADAAGAIRSSTLAERIPTAGLPGELSSLAASFNRMLTRLEEAFGRLSSFSADLAHELRTPINNLRSQVEVALGRQRDATAYRDVLESVLEESERLSEMIDGLIFLASAESPETQIVRTPVDVDRELRSVADLYEPSAADAGVQIKIDTEAAPGLMAALDRTLFQRALSNLVTNALAYTPAGGRVRLVGRRVDGALHVDVADTGVGIPPDHLARISDRFYRVDSSRSSASGGLGLGLAIVRSIMTVHGGSCEIVSEVGRGTGVRLSFPAAALRESEVRQSELSSAPSTRARSVRPVGRR